MTPLGREGFGVYNAHCTTVDVRYTFMCYHINPSGNDVCSWVEHLVQDYTDSERATSA